jgi:protein-disulfide isomerase/uncharacterized membrane protein
MRGVAAGVVSAAAIEETVTMSREAPVVHQAGAVPEAAAIESGMTVRRVRWSVMLVLALAGVAVAGELTALHVRVHLDPEYRSFCAINSTVNCDTVAQSEYSVLFGVPVSVWGLLGFLAMAAAAVPGALGRRAFGGAMLALTGIGALWCAVMAVISVVAIESVCLLCMATYAIGGVLLGMAILEARRGGLTKAVADDLRWFLGRPGLSGGLAVAGGAGLVALLALYPAYWRTAASSGPGGLATGTEGGHPWIGARDPVLTIVEYSDYQCPHCQRGHQELRALVAQHPDKVRLVHRNFPLDQACNPMIKRPFHTRACGYASLAACAGEQGRFWEANDHLFAAGLGTDEVTADRLAEAVGLDRAKLEACVQQRAAAMVRADVEDGMRLGIRGTPTFVVEGRVYPGRVPDEVLASVRGE